jgi:hypothetical protein
MLCFIGWQFLLLLAYASFLSFRDRRNTGWLTDVRGRAEQRMKVDILVLSG